MRIERISVRDFRGVGTLDVELDPAGVTIVEGPNETGKTSLSDAFVMLLDLKDSSNSKVVRDVQPIGRDVGPRVEAELTVGPYRMVYRKQWRRDRMTELSITEPQPEQLSGEAAHNRVREILDEETDRALFGALRYQQGVEISQAAIAEAPSLSAALDAAAGGTVALGGNGGDALLAAVEKERLRYFTQGGAMSGARKKKAEDLEALAGDVEVEEEKIDKLEEAVERHQRIERELADLKAELPEASDRIAVHTDALKAVEEVEHKLESACHERELAEAARREASVARDARADLVEAVETATKALAELETEVESAAPGLEAAMAEVATAEEAVAEAHGAVKAAEREAAMRRERFELLDLGQKRDQLRERHERVVKAEEAMAEAERFLAGCAVDEELAGEIDAAVTGLAVAKGRAEAGRARLRIEALRPVHVALNGEGREIEPGAPIETVISGETEATIGDVARVAVSPPEDAGDADGEVGRSERRLEELLGRAEVRSAEEAHGLLRERSRRETERDNARQNREGALLDLEPERLAAKLERAEERLSALEELHDPVEVSADAYDAARDHVREGTAELEAARSREGERQAGLTVAQKSLQGLKEKGIEQRTRLEGAGAEKKRAEAELAEARGEISDEELEKTAGEADERLDVATTAREQIEADLEASDPGTVRAMLDNDRALKERLDEDVKARQIALAETRAQLELGGHEGLSDRLAEVRAKLEELRRDVDSEDGRAAGAAHLHALLSEKREEAQQAYIGPYAEKVNAYARILYGPDVAVEVDHRDFTVASRTLNGTTVPFGSLSGGAREQLAVLARLACGALVSPAAGDGGPGGVPVIIDDALGYSDPDRLEKLGAALAVAGRDCQVIVLTCEPGRYRGVGGARVVPLDR